MRLIILFFCLSLTAVAQSLVPELFPVGGSKWYTFNSRGYSLTFDSIQSRGQEICFFPFTTIRKNEVESELCQWWGSDHCFPHDKATWMGPKIKQGSDDQYVFYTAIGDSLSFDFNPSLNDSSLVFSNDTLQVFLHFIGIENQMVLGVNDSVWQYRLKAYDNQGNRVNGVLNDLPIEIGKSFGLIRFLLVESFPMVQMPLELSGDENLQKGMYALTQGMIYDFQPGDEYQHSIYSAVSPGPPENNYQYYQHFQVLQRNEDADSLYYQFLVTHYLPEADSQWTKTIDSSFYKHKIIKTLPYGEYDGVKRAMALENWDIPRWTYTVTEDQHLGYCPEENCWGSVDLGGPGGYFEDQYIVGVGESHHLYHVGTTGGSYSSRGSVLVYFKKGNSEWGNKRVLSLAENLSNIQVKVFPQPASNQFRVEVPVEMHNPVLRFTDLQGKLIATYTKPNGKQWMVDCSSWPSGVYQLQLIAKDALIFPQRILVIGGQ